jgi:hypothetical protein
VSELIPSEPPLEQLAERINAAGEQAASALQAGLQHARGAGDLLLQAKARLPHGRWLPWLKANVRFSERTAQAYMRLAKRWGELEAKAQGLADLTFEGGLKLLAAPAEATPPAPAEGAIPRAWLQEWEAAGIRPPATTGAELREFCRDDLFREIVDTLPDDGGPWASALFEWLVRRAAPHLYKTGRLLPPPPMVAGEEWGQEESADFARRHAAESNRGVIWQLKVMREVGAFLSCFPEGGSLRARLRRGPCLDKIKACIVGDHADGREVSDAELSRLLDVPQEGLDEALSCWFRGRFDGFFAEDN